MTRPTSITALGLTVLCGALLSSTMASSASAFTAGTPRPATVTARSAPLAIRCGGGETSVPATWYFPGVRRPTGLVWLQHGFLRGDRNLRTLARYIAAHARALVVAPTLSSNPFAAGGCWINGPAMARGVAALFAGRRTALQRSAAVAHRRSVALPRPFVLAGHSAGGNLATAAAGDTTLPGGAIRDLRRVVLFDAVDFGGAMNDALGRLTGRNFRAVLQIASPPSSCNAFGSGTNALLARRPGTFVGVELLRGTHIDAEGPDTDPLAQLVCGTPLPANVSALRTIAADWVLDGFTGAGRGIIDGTPGQRIRVGSAIAVVLPANP